MSCLASNFITWFAPRSNMSAPSSQEIMRPLNSMIRVPLVIGRAANSPMPLIGDLRFCHSRFCRCSLISFPHSFIDRINSEWRRSHNAPIIGVAEYFVAACSYYFCRCHVESKKGTNAACVKRYWEIIADDLSKAGWSWGIVSAIDCEGRTIWIADCTSRRRKAFRCACR